MVVYGGGNTAMDAARTVRRLGADDAVVVYRRTRAEMPANETELHEALAEGVRMRWLSTIAEVNEGSLRVERMRLDPDGVPQPTGEFDDLGADCVVLALGQDVDRSMLDSVPGLHVVDGVVEVDAASMTGRPGVFASGDASPSPRSVTAGIGQGRAAAASIDRWLSRQPDEAPAPAAPPGVVQPVRSDQLNTWYYSDAPGAVRPELEAARRTSDFSEVVTPLDETTALYEARRCLSCGNCFGCDNCFGVCPDNSVFKVETGHGYAFDYDYCKGCGLCAAECPCGAIVMMPEPS